MKELNKKEVYSLEGLSDEQLRELSKKSRLHADCLKHASYIVYQEGYWRYGFSRCIPTAKAIELF